MRILFTGHRGFLGRELIPHLEGQGHNVVTSMIDYSSEFEVNQFLRFEREYKDFDYILHAAIRGGRRIRKDTSDDFYNNIKMFEVLASTGIPMITFCSGAAYGREGDINNAPESAVGKRIPTDYYGFAKSLITQRARHLSHVQILRFFNVFGPTSQKDMFTSANIRNYINKKEIVVFQDKLMDFFGIDDTKTVVDLYLKKAKILPKEINLVYEDNLMLTDVASMINELSDYTVPVKIVKNGMQNAYCGSGYLLNTMGIGLKGLKHQLRSTYEHLI